LKAEHRKSRAATAACLQVIGIFVPSWRLGARLGDM
jgi:hypothetical protein